jgi:hypothetical protein
MATRKKIVLRRQRRSALNRRKRQTGKRIYRRKVMRGGEENQITYGDLKKLLNYKLPPFGVAIPFFTSVKAGLKTEAHIDIDTLAETTPITIDTLSKQILPVFKDKIIEKLPDAKKEKVRPLLDQLFGLLTTPPETSKEMTDKLNVLIEQIVKLIPTPVPIPLSIITSASSIIVPKLVKVVFAAKTVTTTSEQSSSPASPAASPAASGGGTAAAQPVDLS